MVGGACACAEHLQRDDAGRECVVAVGYVDGAERPTGDGWTFRQRNGNRVSEHKEKKSKSEATRSMHFESDNT